jgi:hypothetical protein
MRSHRIKKRRTALPRRVVPAWTQSDEGVAAFLLAKFPRVIAPRPTSFRQLRRTLRQRKNAILYNEVLYLFYRVNMSEGEIAEELRDMLRYAGRKNHIDAVRDILKVIRKYRSYGS